MTFGTMEVVLVKAQDLRRSEFIGRIEPYVVVQYKTQVRKSHAIRGNAPEWNQKLRFKVEFPVEEDEDKDGRSYKISLRVMDRHRFTSDDFLGQTSIYLKEVFEQGVENGKSELPAQKYRVVSSARTYEGEIKVGVIFTVEKESREKKNNLYGGWKLSKF